MSWFDIWQKVQNHEVVTMQFSPPPYYLLFQFFILSPALCSQTRLILSSDIRMKVQNRQADKLCFIFYSNIFFYYTYVESCEHGHVHANSVKTQGISWLAEQPSVIQEETCSMELVYSTWTGYEIVKCSSIHILFNADFNGLRTLLIFQDIVFKLSYN
jgi:hypothetical protein